MEDIVQTIGAYDRGEIELPPMDVAEIKRSHAGVFRSHTSESEFTKMQIARFLGRTKRDIRQTIGAYDRGEIELPPMDKRGSTVFLGKTSDLEYTKIQIAKFLGRTRDDTHGDYGFESAWKTLALIEDGILETKQFKSLSREEMSVTTVAVGNTTSGSKVAAGTENQSANIAL